MTTFDLEVELISCEVCMKEVPIDEASNPESADYIVHFCGLACYEQWVSQDVTAEIGTISPAHEISL